MGAKIYFVLFFKKREKSRRMNEKKFKDFQKQMTSISKKKKEFNFEGEKNKFSRMIKNKECHFSKKKKKIFFKRTTKINQGFLFKRENSNQETNEDHTSQGNGTTKHASSKV